MDELVINPQIIIPSSDFEVSYSRSGGPGGQHVNTTDTRVRLHFDLKGTEALRPSVKDRIRQAYGNRISKEGALVITADTHRSRHRNVELVRERLTSLIRSQLKPPKKRKKTRPSLGAKKRRLKAKKVRGEVKKTRGRVRQED